MQYASIFVRCCKQLINTSYQQDNHLIINEYLIKLLITMLQNFIEI